MLRRTIGKCALPDRNIKAIKTIVNILFVHCTIYFIHFYRDYVAGWGMLSIIKGILIFTGMQVV